MMPFTTAERKVLGVAAPTPAANAAQLALSAAAQSVQSAAATDGLCQSDLRAGGKSALGADRHSSSDRHAHSPPSHQAWRRQRFRRAQPEPVRRDRGEQQSHHGASARRRGVDLASRRRHRHHEHPARLGDRTHARDRLAHGDRRAPAACVAAVSRRSHFSQRQRRPRRHRHGHRIFGGDPFAVPLGGAGVARWPSPAAFCSPPRSAYSSDIIRRARRQASIPSMRCATSETCCGCGQRACMVQAKRHARLQAAAVDSYAPRARPLHNEAGGRRRISNVVHGQEWRWPSLPR